MEKIKINCTTKKIGERGVEFTIPIEVKMEQRTSLEQAEMMFQRWSCQFDRVGALLKSGKVFGAELTRMQCYDKKSIIFELEFFNKELREEFFRSATEMVSGAMR